MMNEEKSTKECTQCHQILPLTEFFRNKGNPDGLHYECKACDKIQHTAKRKKDPEKTKVMDKIYNRKNYLRYAKFHKAHRFDLKRLVIEYYGGKCACCGESHLEFLQIDHVNGGGNLQRKAIRRSSGQDFYHWLKSNHFPFGFRVLCANCNSAIGYYGYCPHSKVDNSK